MLFSLVRRGRKPDHLGKNKKRIKEKKFVSHFQEKDFACSLDFVDRLKVVLNGENFESEAQSDDPGDEHMAKKSCKKRRRRAGEFTGRQLALKKLEKEGNGAILKTGTWPPLFLTTVKKCEEFFWSSRRERKRTSPKITPQPCVCTSPRS